MGTTAAELETRMSATELVEHVADMVLEHRETTEARAKAERLAESKRNRL